MAEGGCGYRATGGGNPRAHGTGASPRRAPSRESSDPGRTGTGVRVRYHGEVGSHEGVGLYAAEGAAVPAGARIVRGPGEVAPPAVVVVPAERAARWRGSLPAGCVVVTWGSDGGPAGSVLHLPEPSGPVAAAVLEAARRAAAAEAQAARLEEESGRRRRLEQRLLEIGAALTAEPDLEALLDRILESARDLAAADAGSVYLVEEGPDGRRWLRFARAQNASRAIGWRESAIPLDTGSLAGMAAVTGEAIRVADAYAIPEDAPYRFNRSFDDASGYRTRSLLAVPMSTREGEIVGVIQLINRKRDPEAVLDTPEAVEREVVEFTEQDLALLRALAAQAAVVLENSRLVAEIRDLFESFVRASVVAIEQRDPPTRGHSFRVASYTLELAEAVERCPPPRYRGIRFGTDGLRQLRYAALLHDVGKVGVRERVLTKAGKLYPDQERLVRERFHHAARAEQLALVLGALEAAARSGRPVGPDELEGLRRELAAVEDEFDRLWEEIRRANDPAVVAAEIPAALETIARRRFPGPRGEPRRLLEAEELRLLRIRRGNLDETERREIESHVVHSHRFLLSLPWPRPLARVPEIAALHHEKLDGSGYPRGLTADAIPVEVRMLTIADIYDALTASDRPYKPALPTERALAILEEEACASALDRDLVRVFIEAGVHRRPDRFGLL